MMAYIAGPLANHSSYVYTQETERVLADVHEGICGEHIGGRTLAFKVLRWEFYWPTLHKE